MTGQTLTSPFAAQIVAVTAQQVASAGGTNVGATQVSLTGKVPDGTKIAVLSVDIDSGTTSASWAINQLNLRRASAEPNIALETVGIASSTGQTINVRVARQVLVPLASDLSFWYDWTVGAAASAGMTIQLVGYVAA